MRILIAVPCMDSVPSQFAKSLATLNKVGECMVAFQVGSLIYKARHDLALKAIECETDYVLWLDSDMMFDSDTLQKLIDDREKGDIITGLYFRRVPPFTPVLFDQLEIDQEGCKWTNFDSIPDEIFTVGGCGFGCVLMPTSVLFDVFSRYGDAFSPIGGVGEDLAFCWRARQCGYKVVCDPSIKLGHVGHHVITEEFWRTYAKTKAEK